MPVCPPSVIFALDDLPEKWRNYPETNSQHYGGKVLRVGQERQAIAGGLMIKLKRAYDSLERSDGHRFLVERLWPRGIKKSDIPLDGWLKDVAPSTELRKWFSHDPAKWPQFQRRYFTELDSRPEAYAQILAAARDGTVTLIYSSHDTEHNNAVALKEYLDRKLQRRVAGGSPRKAA